MSAFEELLNASEEDIVRALYRFRLFKPKPDQSKLEYIANRLKFTVPQLVCAIGFNPNSTYLNEVFPILGYENYQQITHLRDNYYINDIYEKISLGNLLAIYKRIKYENEILITIPELLKKRLEKIEQKIEITVNSTTIDRYKNEMKAIYFDKIVDVDFVEDRLSIMDSGYRALLNEVAIIVESNFIPVDDVFFRDNILFEERRKMLQRGLVNKELIFKRLEDESITSEEHDLLEEHIKIKQLK